jgi:hypothetical protein
VSSSGNPLGHGMVRDPETGYLYVVSKSESVGYLMTLEKKKEFVSLYKACFPDLTSALEQAGFSRQTYYNHMRIDGAFAKDIQEIREQKADKLESAMFAVAIQPKSSSFMDRIAMLRAYRPGLYTEKRVNLTAKDLDSSTLEAKSGTLSQVIDTEVMDAELSRPVTASQADQVIGAGIQDPRPVTVSQEDSKDLVEKKSLNP